MPIKLGCKVKPEQMITILESRVESLTEVNSKLHELIQTQIAKIHELELQVLATKPV